LSGAFGDIGTDLPLIVGIVLVSGLDPAKVFLMFGIMQALTGVIYGMPMPVQPLKAVAVIAISLKLIGSVILGAGLRWACHAIAYVNRSDKLDLQRRPK
jgi:hypothetical protein